MSKVVHIKMRAGEELEIEHPGIALDFITKEKRRIFLKFGMIACGIKENFDTMLVPYETKLYVEGILKLRVPPEYPVVYVIHHLTDAFLEEGEDKVVISTMDLKDDCPNRIEFCEEPDPEKILESTKLRIRRGGIVREIV